MGGGIFLVLKKREAKNAWYRNLKMKWFLEYSSVLHHSPPPRAWTEGRIQGGLL